MVLQQRLQTAFQRLVVDPKQVVDEGLDVDFAGVRDELEQDSIRVRPPRWARPKGTGSISPSQPGIKAFGSATGVTYTMPSLPIRSIFQGRPRTMKCRPSRAWIIMNSSPRMPTCFWVVRSMTWYRRSSRIVERFSK